MINTNQSTAESFEKLRSLLLEDEWEAQNSLKQDVQQVRSFLKDENFRERVAPIIKEHLSDMQEHFPELYGDVIKETLALQTATSKEEMADALYPLIGLMISKFIKDEIRQVTEKMENTFKQNKFLQKVKTGFSNFIAKTPLSRFFSKSTSKTPSIKVNEIYIIQKGSGFVLANHSKNPESANKDMVAGMLTAIKAFGEDAIGKQSEDLKTIQYDTYTITMYDLHSYYFAAIVEGPITESFKLQFKEDLFLFAKENNLEDIYKKNDQLSEQELSNALKELISGK